MKDIITKKATWMQKTAASLNPDENAVTLCDGTTLHYDYLVLASGLRCDYSTIPGMAEAIQDENSGVVSTYDFEYCQKTWKQIQQFKNGRAIFTMPSTVLKCPGAPQKIMWLFEEYLRDNGKRGDSTVEFWVPGPAMFGVKKYAEMLDVLVKERNILPHFKHSLVSVDGKAKTATFKDATTGVTTVENYDLLHVVPAQSAPAFISKSKLANEAGFVAVDQETLQSTKYPNVFGIGDCTSTPNSKTAAAITKQAPIVVYNLERVMNGEKPDAVYNGYASCPLIIGKNEVILAEFGYGGKLMETFNPDTGSLPYSLIGQEGFGRKRFFSWMKETVFPFAYWNFWPRGMWYGNTAIFKPTLEKKKASE
jgi:sulfide:quinone oxidoreductase